VTSTRGLEHHRHALLRAAWHASWLTDGQIEVIYGHPGTRLGYWGRRLFRPFNLVRRGLRYGFAWARHRLSR